jgi:Methyltransferase domain
MRRRSERRRLLARLPKSANGAEVGSWKGDFAAQLLTRTNPRSLYLIDPWEHRDETTYEQAMFGGHGAEGEAGMQAVYDSVRDRFSTEIERGRVIVRRSRSVAAAAELPGDALDWVYIDGDHTYEAVKADLEAYYRVIRPGGLLAGDDYGIPGWWQDGVTRAVDEFARSGRCEGPTIIGSQFLFTKL